MKPLIPLAAFSFLLVANAVQAATYDWSGATDGNMSGTPANWGGIVPGLGDIARWNAATYTTAPTANANMTIGQLLFDAGNTGTLNFGAGVSVLTLNGISGVGIQLNNGSGTVNTGAANFSLGGDQIWQNNSANPFTVGGTITNASNTVARTLTINGSGSMIFSSGITNGAGTGTTAVIVNTTGGTTTIGASSNFSGGLSIQQGTVKLGNVGAAGLGLVTIGNTGTSGILDLNASGSTRTIMTLATAGTAANQKITNSLSGTVTLNFLGATNSTFGGVIEDGSGTTSVTVNNANAIVTLSGANTYSGVTNVTLGVLNIRHGDALGTTSAATNVGTGGTLQLQGGITTVNESLSIRGTGASGQTGALVNVSGTNNYAGLIAFGAIGGATISSDSGTLNLTNTGTITGGNLAGPRPMTLGGAGNGSVSSVLALGTNTGAGLIKNGTGTWTLLATNTYLGGTTINAGTLLINGNNTAATGAVAVNGGTLGGTGTVGGATTINAGATLSPGNSPGTLAFVGNLTLANGSTYLFEGGDLTTVGGVLDLDDNWTLSLTGSNFINGGSTVIFTFGSLAATPDLLPTFDLSGFTAGFTPGALSLSQVGNTIVLNGLTASVIPEPSAALLFAVGFALILSRRRFRRA